MKRISYLFFLIFLTSIIASSCSSTKTYAQLLADEKSLIDGFIKRNNILVVSTLPTDSILPVDSVWKNKGREIYYLSPSGLYFHLVDRGAKDTVYLALKDEVVSRYRQYTLGTPSDTINNWTTVDSPYPTVFVYGNLSDTRGCSAFQEAASYMKKNYSESKIIVPSKIGFNADMLSVTPLRFDFKIQIRK